MLTDDTGLSSKDTAHRYTDSIVHEVSATVSLFLSELTRVYSYLRICLCFMIPLPYLSASASDTFVTASASVDVFSSHLLVSFSSFSSFLCPFPLDPPIAVSNPREFPAFASDSNVASIAIVETSSFLPIVHAYRPR